MKHGASPSANRAVRTPEGDPGRTPVLGFEARELRTIALVIVAAFVVLASMRIARDFLVPLITGLIISYALDPLVSSLARRRLPRALGAGLVVMALLAGCGTAVYALSDDVAVAISELPAAAQKMRETIRLSVRRPQGPLQQLSKAANEIERAATEATNAPSQARGVTRVQVVQPAFDASEYLRWGSNGAASFAGQFTLLVFLVYFLLACGDLFKRKLVKIAGPSLTSRRFTVQVLDEINVQIAHFLLHLAFASVLVGATTGVAFWWIGVNQPIVWGFAAGVLNTIPYFGPVIITVSAAAAALLQFGSPETALVVAAVSLAITSLEGFLLTPWLMSHAGRMNAVAVFVGLLFWGWMWGLWGMLLATPMLMAIKTICERVDGLTGIAELLGE
jgi:predicted PurR-regulated permease PerM